MIKFHTKLIKFDCFQIFESEKRNKQERECIELCNWVVEKVISYLDNKNISNKNVEIEFRLGLLPEDE